MSCGKCDCQSPYEICLHDLGECDCAKKEIAKRDAELERLRAENAELQCKGESLCCQNGTLLMDNARLREALDIAANRLEGLAIALHTHGTNIDPVWFISEYRAYAKEARAALEGK